MNTTARIESTGKKNRIHVSKETAELLESAGKEHWITPRDDVVEAKGKGKLATFWLDLNSTVKTTNSDASSAGAQAKDGQYLVQPGCPMLFNKLLARGDRRMACQKFGRLVQWNMEVLVSLLKQVEQARRAYDIQPDSQIDIRKMEMELTGRRSNETLIDEVVDTIDIPTSKGSSLIDEEEIELSPAVLEQLRVFVSTIALMYNRNRKSDYPNKHYTKALLFFFLLAYPIFRCLQPSTISCTHLMSPCRSSSSLDVLSRGQRSLATLMVLRAIH